MFIIFSDKVYTFLVYFSTDFSLNFLSPETSIEVIFRRLFDFDKLSMVIERSQIFALGFLKIYDSLDDNYL